MNPIQQSFGKDMSLASTKTDSILSYTPSYKELMQRKENMPPYDTLLYEKVSEEAFTRNFVIRMDSLPDDLVRTKKHKNQEVAEKIGPSTFSLDYASMIKKITVPVFVISGKYDFIIRPKETEALAKVLRTRRLYCS
jgi:proline iminopeptidase